MPYEDKAIATESYPSRGERLIKRIQEIEQERDTWRERCKAVEDLLEKIESYLNQPKLKRGASDSY